MTGFSVMLLFASLNVPIITIKCGLGRYKWQLEIIDMLAEPTIYVSNVDDIRLKVFPFEEMLYLNGEKKFLIIPARSPKDKHF